VKLSEDPNGHRRTRCSRSAAQGHSCVDTTRKQGGAAKRNRNSKKQRSPPTRAAKSTQGSGRNSASPCAYASKLREHCSPSGSRVSSASPRHGSLRVELTRRKNGKRRSKRDCPQTPVPTERADGCPYMHPMRRGLPDRRRASHTRSRQLMSPHHTASLTLNRARIGSPLARPIVLRSLHFLGGLAEGMLERGLGALRRAFGVLTPRVQDENEDVWTLKCGKADNHSLTRD
jgi:hypothetical protein